MVLILRSPQETMRVGRLLSGSLAAGDIVLLYGDFGCGKTVLTKGIAHGLGVATREVISPSFVLMREYRSAKIPLYHFDLYRLSDPGQVLAVGYEEYLYGEGISVVEWAEKLGVLTPKEFLACSLTVAPGKTTRKMHIEGRGIRYERLARDLWETAREK